MVWDKTIQLRLLVLVQLYKQNPLEIFFIFTIYQNYTLALKSYWFLFRLYYIILYMVISFFFLLP